jgi:hypothetical protein
MKTFFQAALTALLFITLSFTSISANASGFYFGLGGYSANMEIEDFDDDEIVPAGFLGYQFIDSNIFMLSAELGYYDLGGFSGPGYDVDSDAFTLAAVGYIPIGPFFEVYAKFGVASVSVDTTLGGNTRDSSGEDAFGGVGFAFDILDTIDIYAEYLRFDNRIDSELYGIGVRFDFF